MQTKARSYSAHPSSPTDTDSALKVRRSRRRRQTQTSSSCWGEKGFKSAEQEVSASRGVRWRRRRWAKRKSGSCFRTSTINLPPPPVRETKARNYLVSMNPFARGESGPGRVIVGSDFPLLGDDIGY